MFKKILIIAIASLGILACGTEADFENYAGIEIETEELRNASFEDEIADTQEKNLYQCLGECRNDCADDGGCRDVTVTNGTCSHDCWGAARYIAGETQNTERANCDDWKAGCREICGDGWTGDCANSGGNCNCNDRIARQGKASTN
ncbi:MAG: hypothetical protein QGI45_09950 [Myxococcota bacterium]|jgi:hypothetical protein|nr:hypothetical protein [Myxococcota bacterium]